MTHYNRIPRKAVKKLPHGEVQKKLEEDACLQKKRAENMLNPSAVISAPIEITKAKSKSSILGGFLKNKK